MKKILAGEERAALLDRRAVLQSAAAAAALFTPGAALAQSGRLPALQKAVTGGKAAAIKHLQDWIALPSIAAENLNTQEGADYVVKMAKDAGFQHAEVVPTKGKPGVFATLDAGAPRWMAVYFMYDVKQFDPSEWSSPPLEGRLVDRPGVGTVMIGRGATNSKGGQSFFISALKAFQETNTALPVNIVLIAEGEEEIASPNFRDIVTRPDVLAALRKCEGLLKVVATQDEEGAVGMSLGVKGAIECELVCSSERWGRGPAGAIHSSNQSRVDSPTWRLIEAMNTLTKENGNVITIEGWDEFVRPLSARDREMIAEAARTSDEAAVKKSLGVKRWVDDLPWQQTLERFLERPTANIQGLVAGYQGPGGMTILPGKASAKMEFRLVPDQKFEDCVAKLNAHLAKRGYSDIEVRVTGGYGPYLTPEKSRIVQASVACYKRLGVKATLQPRSAGGWPGAYIADPPVSLPIGYFGLGDGGGAHAPDEWILIDSADPRIAGIERRVMAYVDYLYELAAI